MLINLFTVIAMLLLLNTQNVLAETECEYEFTGIISSTYGKVPFNFDNKALIGGSFSLEKVGTDNSYRSRVKINLGEHTLFADYDSLINFVMIGDDITNGSSIEDKISINVKEKESLEKLDVEAVSISFDFIDYTATIISNKTFPDNITLDALSSAALHVNGNMKDGHHWIINYNIKSLRKVF